MIGRRRNAKVERLQFCLPTSHRAVASLPVRWEVGRKVFAVDRRLAQLLGRELVVAVAAEFWFDNVKNLFAKFRLLASTQGNQLKADESRECQTDAL